MPRDSERTDRNRNAWLSYALQLPESLVGREKSGTEWQLFTRFCATLLSDLRRGAHAGRHFPSRKEITCTLCLYCLYTPGIETKETG